MRWGTSPGTRYRGQGPTSWASLAARLAGETERSLADESAGPIAQLLPMPETAAPSGEDADGDPTEDPSALLRADIAAARGKALLLETTSTGFGEGVSAAPRRDWIAARLGPNPPAGMVELAEAAYTRLLAACGVPPGLFESGADGTSQREALRRWHQNVVIPLAAIVGGELSERLEVPVRLEFDNYPLDHQSRAVSFQKLVAGGVSVTEALATTGLLAADE